MDTIMLSFANTLVQKAFSKGMFKATIASCLMERGYTIAGGFVRDLLIGAEPTDIDILCVGNSYATREIQVMDIVKLFWGEFTVIVNVENHDIDYSKQKIRIRDPWDNEDVSVDIMGINHLPDVSVNRLTLKEVDGEKVLGVMKEAEGKIQLDEIIIQLMRREYSIFEGEKISKTRLDKIEGKGFKQHCWSLYGREFPGVN